VWIFQTHYQSVLILVADIWFIIEKNNVRIPKAKKDETKPVRIGKIVVWNSSRGFGWLECKGERLFVHLREFKGTEIVPAEGVEFPFLVGTDVHGRLCAKGVSASLVNGQVKFTGWLLLAALLFWPIAGMTKLPVAIYWPIMQMIILSAVVFRLYAHDKRQAIHHALRVPQTIMQLGELAGGWPGAFVAQRIFRHKSTNKSYQSIFWGIILIYQVIGADLFFDRKHSKEIWKSMGEFEIMEQIFK
jgi:uncharacterized membrane protein YsdA (DUF1294 family)/cold shock CspA family protein